MISGEPVIYPDGGPWKEFIVQDLDGYGLAFGGVDCVSGGGEAAASPIQGAIGSVILWVRDLDCSARLYGKLMGLPVRPEDRHGHLHVFKLPNGTDMMLDSNGMESVSVPETGPVLFMLHTDEIGDAYKHAQELGFQITFGIVRYPRVSFFNIKDTDGNIITVAQRH